MYQWQYGIPLSGLSFPLVTASGTFAVGYDCGQLSGMISINGGNWSGLGGRISGIPGNGVYTVASLSSTEMTCYSWMIRVTAASGCLDQCILGYNLSGNAKTTDVSGLATLTSVSAEPGILTAVSGVTATVNYSSVANQVWNTLLTNNTSSTTFGNLQNVGGAANVSSIALQVWNTVQAGATSTTTFGGMVNISGLGNVLAAISGIPLAVASGFSPLLVAVSGIPLVIASGFSPILSAVSGLTNNVSGLPGVLTAVSNLATNVSGLPGVMTAVSGIPLAVGSGWVGCSGINGVMGAVSGVPAGVGLISIQDGDALTSGTLAHTARLLRWFSWGPLIIDKTYTPNRLYLQTDNVNVSSWWSLTDGVNSTNRARGG